MNFPFSHAFLSILLCGVLATPSQADSATDNTDILSGMKRQLESIGDSDTMLRKRRNRASFERSERLRQHLTGQAQGLTSSLGGLDGLPCAQRAVKRAHLLRNIQLAKEEVVRRALTGDLSYPCFSQPDIKGLIRKTRLYGSIHGDTTFRELMENMTPDEIYQAASWAEGHAGNWESDIDYYVAELREKAATDPTSAAELEEYEELTRKRFDSELGIRISALKRISMTPGDKLRSINSQYVKKKKAPLYQKAYYMFFDKRYQSGAVRLSYSGDSWSDQMMRAAMGHQHEMDSSWRLSSIVGNLIHFFSLLP